MTKVMHFDSPEQRMAFLKGKFEEIVPKKAESQNENAKNEHFNAENEKKSSNKKVKSKKHD